MRAIKQISLCSLMSALSVSIMLVGSLIFTNFTIVIVSICGFLNAILVREVSIKRAYCSFFVTSVLAYFLVSKIFMLMCYIIFGGIYPLIEVKINEMKIKSHKKYSIKFSFFVLSSLIMIGFHLLILGGTPSKNTSRRVFHIIYFSHFIWCLYFDYYLKTFKIFYEQKLKPKILKYFFSY